jgi:hypothetical protein
VCFDFLYKCCMTNFSFQEELSKLRSKIYNVLSLKCLLFLSDFIFLKNFLKIHKCQFSWKSVQLEQGCSRRTDGWADRREEANCRNSQFGERAEIYLCHPSLCNFKFHQNSSNNNCDSRFVTEKYLMTLKYVSLSLSQLRTIFVGYLTTLSVTQVIQCRKAGWFMNDIVRYITRTGPVLMQELLQNPPGVIHKDEERPNQVSR